LKKGDKALIGNSAYRRYLRKVSDKDKRSFAIDAGKLAEDARFDGVFVLRTNAKVTPLQAVLRYRDLLRVEDLFRRTKAIMRTRPIFHSSDAAIRGSRVLFLPGAFDAQPSRRSRPRSGRHAGMEAAAARSRSVATVRLAHRDADWLVRTDAAPNVAVLFRAAHLALPPRARHITAGGAMMAVRLRATPPLTAFPEFDALWLEYERRYRFFSL
jgi:hypothetical protein